MINKIKTEILPLYKSLLEENTFKDICTFSFQWGKNYPFDDKAGILFVGKAVNSWVTEETDVEKIFDINNSERIFARDDQMEWVNNLSGNIEGYNTRKSAFWRVVKRVSETFYPKNWYDNVAWTNLYKIAPFSGGNPNGKLQKAQREYCFSILKKEIEILTPQYVIMLTSGWEWSFLRYLNDNKEVHVVETKNWGKYTTSTTQINGVNYIFSQHPQGKKEWDHRNAIVELIDEQALNTK
jgi:hypothetical protein